MIDKLLGGMSGGGESAGGGGGSGAGVGGMVGGMFDMYAAQQRGIADRQSANDRRVAASRMAEEWEMMNAPSIDDLSYNPVEEQYMGDLVAPDVYRPQALQSEFAGISTDPRFQEAQIQSLGGMDDIIEGGGLTDMDRLNQMRAMQAAEQQASTQQSDIMQDMARRGMSGSGQEMLAKLTGSQGSVDRAAEAGQYAQAEARQRALQALMQKGSMAGDMRGQEFGEKAQRAQQMDALARFNQSQALGQENLATGMDWGARQRNLDTKQGIAGNTASAKTDAAKHRAGAAGDAYSYGAGKLRQSQGIREQMRGEAYADDQRSAQQKEDFTKSVGDMFGGVAGSAAGSA